jgi:exopolysaccharide production protein ExoQ
MPPKIAALVWIIGIIGLFKLDRDSTAKTSKALWIPVAWLGMGTSRMLSGWLVAFGFVRGLKASPEELLDGSPIDRYMISALVVVSLIVLIRRGKKVSSLLRSNVPLVLFFLYCVISVIWSDFPLVAFKRWVKDLGDLAVILIIFTDQNVTAAVQRVFARAGFVLVSGSILAIKYFPDVGRAYHPWSWSVYYVGLADGKNGLGCLCLVYGVASVWRLVSVYKGEEGERKAGRLIAHGVILGMTIWLFIIANSVTSWSCFLMATVLILVSSFRMFGRKTLVVQLLVAAMLFVSFSALFLDTGGSLVKSMARDPSLTGRTEVWKDVLELAGNPLVGTGFESFWLGRRLEKMWSLWWWHPNEAHNGYLEVYLNLGWIGVALLALLLFTGYRNALAAYRRDLKTGRLRLAFFVVAVAYNFTESAIRIMHPIWVIFLFATLAVPGPNVTDNEAPSGIDQDIKLSESELQIEPVYRTAQPRRAFDTLR